MDDLVKRADEVLKDVTPGPWTDWSNKGAIGVDCERADIAHCSGFDTLRSRKTERANARFIAAARELVPAMRDRIEADAERINILEMREVSRNAERLSALNNNAAQAQMIAKKDARIAELEGRLFACSTDLDTYATAHTAAEARVKVLENDNAKLMLALNYFLLCDPDNPGSWMFSRNDAEDLARAVIMDRAALEGEK